MRPGHWADTPFNLIPTPAGPRNVGKEHASLVMAQNMAHIHNCILRCLNAIYNQACSVKSERDITDLLLLCKFWHDELHHHHGVEEDVVFPGLEKVVEEATGQKGAMQGNIDQHHLFMPGLEALHKYATETTPANYDGEKLRAVIESFGTILQQHLAEEITTLLSLAPYDNDKLMAAWNAGHEHAMKTINQNVQLPMMLKSFDANYEGKAFGPDFPWFLYWLVSLWFSRTHSSVWRLLPCDTWGRPKPLPFAPKTLKA